MLWRSPNRWFDIAFLPVMDVILFGSLGTYAARQSHRSGAGVAYLLAGIMLFHVLFQVQVAVATGFMEETWSRNLLNVMVTPVTEVEYVAGLAVFGLVKLAFALRRAVRRWRSCSSASGWARSAGRSMPDRRRS